MVNSLASLINIIGSSQNTCILTTATINYILLFEFFGELPVFFFMIDLSQVISPASLNDLNDIV